VLPLPTAFPEILVFRGANQLKALADAGYRAGWRPEYARLWAGTGQPQGHRSVHAGFHLVGDMGWRASTR